MNKLEYSLYNDLKLSNCSNFLNEKNKIIWEYYLHLDKKEIKLIFEFVKKYNMIRINYLVFQVINNLDNYKELKEDFEILKEKIPKLTFEFNIYPEIFKIKLVIYLKRIEYLNLSSGFDKLTLTKLQNSEWKEYVSNTQWLKIKEKL